MRPIAGHNGFSLVEVLFAVMVLTMGLVFVACQFPVGLSLSRDISDATRATIESHNAAVMTELHLEGMLAATPDFKGNTSPNFNEFLNTVGVVRFLCRPNLRWDSDDMVMDDPLGLSYTLAPSVNYHYGQTGSWGKNELPGYVALNPSGTTDPPDTIGRRNLGMSMLPAVDMTDRDVQGNLPANFGSLADAQQANWLNDEIPPVARERKYSWAALYRCMDPSMPPPGGQEKTFRFFIFTLRNSNANLRYAMQDNSDWYRPVPLGDSEDRFLPVPWVVAFDDPVDISNTGYFPLGEIKDSFYVGDWTASGKVPFVMELLRVGSIMVDASRGYVYEIMEIEGDLLQIRPELQDDLGWFWVFPPAIVDGSTNPPVFADPQPVVSVTEKVIRF